MRCDAHAPAPARAPALALAPSHVLPDCSIARLTARCVFLPHVYSLGVLSPIHCSPALSHTLFPTICKRLLPHRPSAADVLRCDFHCYLRSSIPLSPPPPCQPRCPIGSPRTSFQIPTPPRSPSPSAQPACAPRPLTLHCYLPGGFAPGRVCPREGISSSPDSAANCQLRYRG